MLLVGIDLGGTAIKAGAISSEGKIVARREIPSALERGASDLLDRMAQLARDLGAQSSVGMGVPGLVDIAGGRVLQSPNLAVIERVRLVAELAQRLALPASSVHLENDANAAAIGEHWLGCGRNERDLLFVTLGTGVGGGLILDGGLYAGPGGMAGEIGHVVVDPDGPRCGCGSRGCLEQLASASAASRRAQAAGLPRSAPGNLVRLAQEARAAVGPERELLVAIGRDLGRGLASAISILDLRCFVVGGGFGAALDVMLPGVREGIAERCYGERLASVRVAQAELGADAGWIGAARLGMLRSRA
ncbi:MAG: ROK family protein [Planctomycetes bacterium]|nr:ROK family protein [Planctomycetota bacterium]